jgi:hypothetical protein
MRQVFIVLVLFAGALTAQKCTKVFDEKNVNVVKTMQCVNLRTMVDISEEIRENWTSIAVVNKASHPTFSNNAGNSHGFGCELEAFGKAENLNLFNKTPQTLL